MHGTHVCINVAITFQLHIIREIGKFAYRVLGFRERRIAFQTCSSDHLAADPSLRTVQGKYNLNAHDWAHRCEMRCQKQALNVSIEVMLRYQRLASSKESRIYM